MSNEPQPTKLVSAMEDTAEFVEVENAGRRSKSEIAQEMLSYRHKEGHIPFDATEPDNSFYDANGGVVASRVIDREQPWHHLMMYLKARGVTNREIARRIGKSEVYVGQVVRQPWFREQMEAMIDEEGGELVQEVLKGEVLNSIYVLVDVRDNIEAKPSERVAAANSLIDRVLGKAAQTIVQVDGGRSEFAKEQSKLESEIATVEKELKELGVS